MAYNGKKKTTKVFHVRSFYARLVAIRGDYEPCAVFPDDYRLVAEVETNSVSQAWLLTNDVGCDWWLNDEVTAYVTPCRSTSVGDVLVLPDGKTLRICGRGFERILED